MKKRFKTFGIVTLAVALMATLVLSMAACKEPHVHTWSDWQRSETEHRRICRTCGEEEKGTHATDSKCPACGAHFKILSIGYTSGGDAAHADFALEANEWFPKMGKELFFTYDFSTSYDVLNDENLANYDLVMFLNGIPGSTAQQNAFRKFMENGGAFMAYHSAAFAMWDNHVAPSEWHNWFSNTLLGCGEYGNRPRPAEDGVGDFYWNTWDPTQDYMKVEKKDHFATKNMELDENDEFLSSYCEWYAWMNDLMNDPNFDVLITLNPTPERPAGNDPRPELAHQIWKSGHHPIAWSSKTYNMIYMNWGHNLQSYNHFEKESKTFSSAAQNKFMIDGMYGLVEKSLEAKNK